MALSNSYANSLVDNITGKTGTGRYIGLGTSYDPVTGVFTELQSDDTSLNTYAEGYTRIALSALMYNAGSTEQGLGQKIASNRNALTFPINLAEGVEGDWPAVFYVGIFQYATRPEGADDLIACGALEGAGSTGIVVEHNQVALFKVKDFQVSIDLNPLATVTKTLGKQTTGNPIGSITIPASEFAPHIPIAASTDKGSTATATVDSSTHAVTIGYGTGGSVMLGTTNIHVLDGTSNSGHLIQTIVVDATSFKDLITITTTSFEALDTNWASYSLTAVAATSSNDAFVMPTIDNGVPKVKGGTLAGTATIRIFGSQDTNGVPIAIYKVKYQPGT